METFEFNDKEKDLAKKVAALTGALIQPIPGDAAKKKAYLQLIAQEMDVVAENATGPVEKPLKNISDKLTDALHAIHAVLPEYADAAKQRAKARFKSAVSILNNLLDMVGL